MDVAADDPRRRRCRPGGRSAVFADYDVDGASSAALLVRWFRAMGAELPIYVPDRITEGYGPSAGGLRHAEGVRAPIWSSPSTAARRPTRPWPMRATIGLKVVVIDHHLMRERAAAGLRPWSIRTGRTDTSGQGHLAAAGVVFVLLAALNREARRGACSPDRPEPDIRQWLDLAAMGAICDVTGLTGFNRALTGPGPEGHVRLGQSRACRPCCDVAKAQGPATVVPRRLHPGAADQRRRADRPVGPGRAAAVDRRPGGGRGPGRGTGRPEHLAQGGRDARSPRGRAGHRARRATTPTRSAWSWSPATAGIPAWSASSPGACASASASRWSSSASTGRRHRQGLGALAAGRESRPGGAGGLRGGAAAGRAAATPWPRA